MELIYSLINDAWTGLWIEASLLLFVLPTVWLLCRTKKG